METNAGAEAVVNFWQRWAGGILAALVTAGMIGGFGWAMSMQQQMQHLAFSMTAIQKELEYRNEKLGELRELEKRVTRIEDTRFTEADAEKLQASIEELRMRVRVVEAKP